MLSVLYNVPRTLAFDLPARADADPVATLYAPAGDAVATNVACARGTTDTTITAAAKVGDMALALDSATGVVVGRRYLLGGPESEGGETVTVRAIAGTNITLVRPLILARAAGTSFVSPRITFTVPAQTRAARNYRAEIAFDVGGEPFGPVPVPFDVTRYAIVTHLSIESVRDLDPHVTKKLPPGIWWPGLVAESFAILQRRIALTRDPGALQGTFDLTTAHAYLVRELLAETAGKDFEDYRASMATRCEQEFTSALANTGIDMDGDGVAEESARWNTGIKLRRA